MGRASERERERDFRERDIHRNPKKGDTPKEEEKDGTKDKQKQRIERNPNPNPNPNPRICADMDELEWTGLCTDHEGKQMKNSSSISFSSINQQKINNTRHTLNLCFKFYLSI